jgi:hypothetical protein
VHDFKAESSHPDRLSADPLAVPRWTRRRLDPVAAISESDLGVWLGWLEASRGAQADNRAMRRLEVVCGTGWTAVTLVTLAFPLAGVIALVFGVALFVLTLIVAYVVIASVSSCPGGSDDASASPEWWSLGPSERATLVRIINLSRVTARPLGARLLLSELDEALAAEPFASWSALRELHDMVQLGGAQLIPFGQQDRVESTYAMDGE